jgi:hypothetical protein
VTTAARGALAAAVAALAYAGTVRNGFVRDDFAAVADNPVVRGAVPIRETFRRNAYGGLGADRLALYRPVPMLLFRTEWAAGHGSPALFHAVNAALHAGVCAAAVWALSSLAGGAVFAAALLFAVLAAPAEAVEAIVGRWDLLVALGALLGLGLHLRGRTAAAAAVAFLAMLCKESGAFVPAAWLAAEVLLRPPARPELLRRARPYFAYAAAVAAGIAMRALAFSPLTRPWMSPLNNPLVLVQGPARWLGAARNVFRYAASVIDPGYRLYACGVPDCGAASAGDWRAWLGLLIMAAIVAAPFFLRRRDPLAAAGLAWCAIFFLPVSSFFVAGPGYAERLLYLPFLGLSLAAAAGAKALGTAARRPALGWGLLAAFGVANLIAVQQRHLDWRSFAELSVADADRLPGNGLLESIAAVHDFERHDATGALARAERALRPEPGNVLALQVKGLALDRLGRPAEAEQALLLAFEESGRAPPLTEDYVRFLLRHRRPAEARAALEKARAARPGENVLPQLDAEIERRR